MLITTDSIQNFGLAPGEQRLSAPQLEPSFFIGKVSPLMGFRGIAVTPPMFFKLTTASGKPDALAEDYHRLYTLNWDAILTSHGTPIRSGAKKLAGAAHTRQFKRSMVAPS